MSAWTVTEHALTVYYDGHADLVGKLLANLRAEIAAEVRAEATAERDALQARLNAVLDICDREQRNAMRWQDPIPVPEWVAPVQRAALGDDVRKSDGATIDIRDALRMLAGGAA